MAWPRGQFISLFYKSIYWVLHDTCSCRNSFETDVSMEIIKTSQRHPNFWKLLYISTIPNNVWPSKLIFEINRWTGPCVMRFLSEGCSEHTMILHLCGSGKYTTVLCFSIRGGDASVPAPSRTWDVEGFLERSLMCWVITRLGCVFHFGTSEIKWRKEDTMHCNNLTLELVGWRLSIKRHQTLSSKKVVFLYLKIYLFI